MTQMTRTELSGESPLKAPRSAPGFLNGLDVPVAPR
jgi:hypothetical protein